MIPRCCSLPVKRSFIAVRQGPLRFYSSSYHDRSSSSNGNSNSNSNNNRKSEEPDAELPPADNASVQQPSPPAQRLTFMPVVNMPESEFAHNAFFSLHRPLLGLSSADERPFFSTRSHLPPTSNETIREILGMSQTSHDIDTDDAVAQYMMQLKPFELPHKHHNSHFHNDNELDNDMDELLPSSADDLEVGFDAGAMHLDPSLPMYYMPESDQVVDYLTAMQDKLAKQDVVAEGNPENGSLHVGRKRGSNRPIIYATTSEEAKRKAILIQQYRQRARRQRPINRLLIDRKTK